MSGRLQNTQISISTMLFLVFQISLFVIAVSVPSFSAFWLFWLGVAVFLTKIDPAEWRVPLLTIWMGLTFAILAYVVQPENSFPRLWQSHLDPMAVLSFLLYLSSAISIIGTLLWYLLPPAPVVTKETEIKGKKRQS